MDQTRDVPLVPIDSNVNLWPLREVTPEVQRWQPRHEQNVLQLSSVVAGYLIRGRGVSIDGLPTLDLDHRSAISGNPVDAC
jgi:hypothetical protein